MHKYIHAVLWIDLCFHICINIMYHTISFQCYQYHHWLNPLLWEGVDLTNVLLCININDQLLESCLKATLCPGSLFASLLLQWPVDSSEGKHMEWTLMLLVVVPEPGWPWGTQGPRDRPTGADSRYATARK